ncbi:MAG: AHH domain-containing protein [Polyangiaceae bacterium]|nr:AHH domain-containing protein [Polyangiaceae bacterium]
MADAQTHFQKSKKRESRLTRGQNYRKKCKAGFMRSKKYSQVHHILCDHSVSARMGAYAEMGKTQEYIDYLEDCLWVTPWSINDPSNLIGLPLNEQYRDSNGLVPVNLPSHQVDHNTADGYTAEVSQWLVDNVWDTLTVKKEPHDVDVKKLKELLEKGTDNFKGKLATRGARVGGMLQGIPIAGTKDCWSHRHELDDWYMPFSMGLTPSPRFPGVGNDPSLERVFEKLG